MAIKLADTARPNNYVDDEHLGTFPVAFAEDVWFEDGTRLSDKTFDGQSIQKEELPFASTTELGKVYQYIGTSGTYEHGCFYECVNDSDSDYEWKELRVIKNAVVYTDTEPTIGAYTEGSVIVYSGESTNAYKKGHHYKYVVGEPHTLNLFTGENVTIHATTYLRVLEDELVVGAHTYNEAGDNSGYIISVGEDSVEYYSYYYSQVMTVTNIQKGASSTINITDYLDIGGSGSGESNTLYADNPIGSIVPYGGVTAPNGWLICQGQSLLKSEYSDLFNAIGYNFGGSGSTFNLPNITQLKQDYTAKSQLDTWTSNLEDGSEAHTITIDNDGSYYFEIVLSNASSGKRSNNISLTGDNNVLVCTWGYIGTGAQLQNKTIFLKAGTYVLTHICETTGIGGTAVVTVYNTRNEPIGSYIIKAKHTPVPSDFMDAVNDAMNECKILPYEFNQSSNVSAFNRKWLYEGNPITWTATHTGRLTVRCLKHGDGYSLYLKNQNNVMLDSYDNFLTGVEQTSITLQAWVRKGDSITLTSNLPASTDYADRYFVQTGLLAYNNNFD